MTFSMTGFARQEVTEGWGTLSIEIKSVNHRYLETHFRMPDALKAMEPKIRELIKKSVKRGKLDIQVRFNPATGSSDHIEVNTDSLQNLHSALSQVSHIIPEARQPTTLELLAWPGVTQAAETDADALNTAMTQLTQKALTQLSDHRTREGAELSKAIEERLQLIGNIVIDVKEKLPVIIENQKANLATKLAEFKVELDEQRLEQEIVLLAQKADVAEELDRLNAHIEEARHILKQKGAVGRQLDFLMQEFNREANTLSSKSIVTDTTRSAVELKVLIEQMREQVQNIE